MEEKSEPRQIMLLKSFSEFLELLPCKAPDYFKKRILVFLFL